MYVSLSRFNTDTTLTFKPLQKTRISEKQIIVTSKIKINSFNQFSGYRQMIEEQLFTATFQFITLFTIFILSRL
jgi:hypothetical protein